MTHKVEYVDVSNTGITLFETKSAIVPRRHERVVIEENIIGKVDVVDWRINEDITRAIVRVQIDYSDTDSSNLPEHHPLYTENHQL